MSDRDVLQQTGSTALEQAASGNIIGAGFTMLKSFSSLWGGATQADKDRKEKQEAFINQWDQFKNTINQMQWSTWLRPQAGVDRVDPAVASSPEYSRYMSALTTALDDRTEAGKDASQSHTVGSDRVDRFLGTGNYSGNPGHWQVLLNAYRDLAIKFDPAAKTPEEKTVDATTGAGTVTGSGGFSLSTIMVIIIIAIIGIFAFDR